MFSANKCEGFAPGVWAEIDYGPKYASIEPVAVNATTKVPYGCWFVQAPGSGIWLNVRRTLLANNFTDAQRQLGLPVPSVVSDRLLCLRALRLGFDSIQFNSGHEKWWRELVYCSGGCDSEAVCGGCVPDGVPLRDHMGQTCTCQEANNLNCGCSTIYTGSNWELPLKRGECNRYLPKGSRAKAATRTDNPKAFNSYMRHMANIACAKCLGQRIPTLKNSDGV